MSKETNTPRTAAGLTEEQHQAILDLALPTASTEGPNAWTQDRINERVRFARELERIAGPAIEAEAAHPDLLKIANEQWERGYAIGKAQAASPIPSGAAVTAASGVPSAPPAPDGSQAEAAAPTPGGAEAANTPRTAAIRKALGTGYVSWSRGDGWYATQGKDGVTYDEAEAAFKEAYAALDAIEAEAASPTPAGRPMIECLCGDLLLTVEDMFEHLRIQHALDDCPEAEASAPTPADDVDHSTHEHTRKGVCTLRAAPTLADLPRTRGDGTVAYEPSDEPAAPLDVDRLALAIANVSGDGRVLDVDREETRKVAAEYNRLAAARPLDIDQLQQDGAQ